MRFDRVKIFVVINLQPTSHFGRANCPFHGDDAQSRHPIIVRAHTRQGTLVDPTTTCCSLWDTLRSFVMTELWVAHTMKSEMLPGMNSSVTLVVPLLLLLLLFVLRESRCKFQSGRDLVRGPSQTENQRRRLACSNFQFVSIDRTTVGTLAFGCSNATDCMCAYLLVRVNIRIISNAFQRRTWEP